jgi:uncharacterized protein
MALVFEWDENKARVNFVKHSVSFEEASSIFSDENSITIDYPEHSKHEKRFITLGLSYKRRMLVAVHT